MNRPPICVRISRAALHHNLAVIRRTVPQSKVMAVIKANAYGHGLIETARALAAADALAVARLDEAVMLREAGVQSPLVLLEGVATAEQLTEAVARNLELVVHDPSQLALLQESASTADLVVWLKADTGMNRLGFRAEGFRAALAQLRAMPAPPREIRALTHLARAEEVDVDMTSQQIARFTALTHQARILVTSIGNSAGIFGWEAARSAWVRPGLALYGVSPFAASRQRPDLLPAMSFLTTVIAVRKVPRGETVGYGAAWRAERDSRIAVLAAGYGDGVPRSLPNGAPVLIHAQRVAVVGRVSMDMLAVDVTDAPNVRVGDAAELWGTGLPVEEVADWAATIAYDLLCGVRGRVPHLYD